MTCAETWPMKFKPFDHQNSIYRPQSLTSLSANCVTRHQYDVTSTWADTRSAQREFFISSQGMRSLLNDIEIGLDRFNKPHHSSEHNLYRLKAERKGPVTRGGKILSRSRKSLAAPYTVRHGDVRRRPARALSPPSGATTDCTEKTPYKLENLLAWMNKGKKKAADKLKKKVAPMSGSKPQEIAARNHRVGPQTNLREVLNNKDQTASFRKFLAKELSEENLDFWFEVENYKRLKGCKQQRAAAKIFYKYLSNASESEVNIDAEVRQLTKQRVQTPDQNSFDVAQRHIFYLMESDSFRRYAETTG